MQVQKILGTGTAHKRRPPVSRHLYVLQLRPFVGPVTGFCHGQAFVSVKNNSCRKHSFSYSCLLESKRTRDPDICARNYLARMMGSRSHHESTSGFTQEVAAITIKLSFFGFACIQESYQCFLFKDSGQWLTSHFSTESANFTLPRSFPDSVGSCQMQLSN